MHLGMSYTELRRLPVRYRTWYIKRLSKHFEDKRKSIDKTPDSASSQGSFDKFEKMVNQKL
jgi:hypothetical protein